jgi:hypothetical protein
MIFNIEKYYLYLGIRIRNHLLSLGIDLNTTFHRNDKLLIQVKWNNTTHLIKILNLTD